MSRTTDEEIVELAKTLTYQEIGDRVGLSRQRIQQIVKAAGLATGRKRSTHACEICGKQFTRLRTRRYCSDECRKRVRQATCIYCGAMVTKGRTRCRKCYGDALSKAAQERNV